MICKIKSRVDFSGIVNYANDIKAKSARVIGSNGVLLVSNRTIVDSFEAQLRIPDSGGRVHHLSKPVKHISIAFSPKDTGRFPDNEEGDRFMEQIAREWIQEMGIDPDNTQYIIARHFDKDHPHCHLVFNRIANDGSVISDKFERRRNEEACKRIKKRHGLTFGKSNSREINPDRLRRYDAARLEIRDIVLSAIDRAGTWKEFDDLLRANGITLHLCADKNTGRIRGLAFENDGFRISGSRLGLHGKFTYGNLANKFGRLNENHIFSQRNMPDSTGWVEVRNVVYLPLIRFIQRIAGQYVGANGINREHEVGNRHRYDRIDDYIPEEQTSKIKL